MGFHRLAVPTYLGGLPAGFDYINNAISGTPAPADVAKSGGVNAGTYFIAFGEDASSSNSNRANSALAENCDLLDDVVSGQTPVLAELQGTLVAPTSLLQMTGLSVYVGTTSYGPSDVPLLIKILNADGDEMYDPSSGVKVEVNQILDSTNSFDVVGTEASHFHTSPWLSFVPDLPAGPYRIVYGARSKLVEVSKTRTRSDAFTRAILGCHLVSARSNRFFLEASRRSVSGSIEALVCSRLETPAQYGDNIVLPTTPTMYIDLDPVNAAPGGRELRVRTASANELFSVLEDAPNTRTRLKAGYGLALRDSKMTYDHPITSTTVGNNIRIGERSPGSAGEVRPVFDTINSRWTITVGNGTTTFGDFNGSSAIEDAVAWYQVSRPGSAETQFGNGLTVLVKAGEYTVSDLAVEWASSEGTSLIIQGVGTSYKGGMVRIIVPATATTGGFLVGAGQLTSGSSSSELTLRDVIVTSDTSPAGSIAVKLNVDGALTMENCFLDGVSISVGNGRSNAPVLRAYRCRFATTSSKTVIPQVTGRWNCTRPVVKIEDVTGVSVIEGQSMLFEDCLFATINNYPVVEMQYGGGNPARRMESIVFNRCHFYMTGSGNSGGDPTGNGGVFAIAWQSGAGISRIERLVWQDCHVRGGLISASCRMLLYLNQQDASSYVSIGQIEVRGGKWTVPQGAATMTPFYIGGTAYDEDSRVERVLMSDVELGWYDASGPVASTYGVAPVLAGAGSAPGWGAFFISTNVLTSLVRVKFSVYDTDTTSGELYVRPYGGEVVLDSIRVGEFITNTGTTPPVFRVLVDTSEGAIISRASLNRVSIISKNALTGGAGALGGIGLMSVASPFIGYSVRVTDCVVYQYKVASTCDGFRVVMNPSTSCRGVLFERCVADGAARDGFSIVANSIENVLFRNCEARNCGAVGIHVESTVTTIVKASYIGNYCFDNGNYGILHSPQSWQEAIVVGNMCLDNDSGGDAVQILLGRGSNGGSAVGTLHGNVCDGVAGGKIEFPGHSSGTGIGMCGSQTSHTGNPALANQITTATVRMIHNDAEAK